MKIFLTMLLTLLAANNMNQHGDFRGFSWETSKNKVLQLETEPLIKIEKNRLVYRTKFWNDDFLLVYKFLQDRLIQGGYNYNLLVRNVDEYIEKFMKHKNLLEQKYGEPSCSFLTNDLDSNKRDPEDCNCIGDIGHIEYYAAWDFKSTSILLTLDYHDISNGFKILYKYNGIMANQDRVLKRREQDVF